MNEIAGSPIEMILDEIDRDACIELLRTQSVGRLAVADHGYYPPHIVPVNFALDGDSVVFRSDDGLKLRLSVLALHSVSFEVDEVDREGAVAWSVVVQGRAEVLTQGQVDALPHGEWLQALGTRASARPGCASSPTPSPAGGSGRVPSGPDRRAERGAAVSGILAFTGDGRNSTDVVELAWTLGRLLTRLLPSPTERRLPAAVALSSAV